MYGGDAEPELVDENAEISQVPLPALSALQDSDAFGVPCAVREQSTSFVQRVLLALFLERKMCLSGGNGSHKPCAHAHADRIHSSCVDLGIRSGRKGCVAPISHAVYFNPRRLGSIVTGGCGVAAGGLVGRHHVLL